MCIHEKSNYFKNTILIYHLLEFLIASQNKYILIWERKEVKKLKQFLRFFIPPVFPFVRLLT